MTSPLSVLGDGNVKVTWLATLAAPSAPSAALLNAVGAIDLTCYLTADGLTPGADEQTTTDDRLCDVQSGQKPGRFSSTLSLRYVYQGQLPAAADNKAQFTLQHLTTGFIIIRWGMAYADTYAAAQIVDVYTVQCGKQIKQPLEQNSVLKIDQKMFVGVGVYEDAVVVA